MCVCVCVCGVGFLGVYMCVPELLCGGGSFFSPLFLLFFFFFFFFFFFLLLLLLYKVSYDFSGFLKPIPMSVRKKMIIVDAGSHEIRCGFNGVRCRPERVYRTTVPGHQLNEDDLELSFGSSSQVRSLTQ
jgi:hypothetical protein